MFALAVASAPGMAVSDGEREWNVAVSSMLSVGLGHGVSGAVSAAHTRRSFYILTIEADCHRSLEPAYKGEQQIKMQLRRHPRF